MQYEGSCMDFWLTVKLNSTKKYVLGKGSDTTPPQSIPFFIKGQTNCIVNFEIDTSTESNHRHTTEPLLNSLE